MKRLSIIFAIIVLGGLSLFSQNVSIPDTNFLAALIEKGVDTNKDGQISYAEAEGVKKLNCAGTYSRRGEIVDMTGIDAFVNLDTLDCSHNQITNLNLTNNTKLKWVDCSYNQLTNLNLSNNTKLEWVACWLNHLTGLDVSNNISLEYLDCGYNNLTQLDVSKNTSLTYLSCSGNQLTSLDVSNNPELSILSCGGNPISSLDVSNNTKLEELGCENCQLTNLAVSDCLNLRSLYCPNNQLTNLDISNNTALEWLTCNNNNLTKLDISNCFELTSLTCYQNYITSLALINNPLLEGLSCGSNLLTNLDVSQCPNLIDLFCGCNTGYGYYGYRYCPEEVALNQITNIDLSNNLKLQNFECGGNLLTSLDVSSNTWLYYLKINNMPSLGQVCVASIPLLWMCCDMPTGIDTSGSPNVIIDTICASSNPTQIELTDIKKQIEIYPNPTDGILNINMENSLTSDIEIYNINGSLIYSKPMNSTQQQIDLSAYPKGLYFVKVRQQDVQKVGKVVVR